MRLLLSLVLGLFLLSPALAETITIDTSKLTVEQLRAITQVEQSASTDAFSPERLNEYAEIGKNVGAGLATAAREMGVAVNEFAGSGVGQVALFLIVWKVAGAEIVGGFLGIIMGFVWLAVVVKTWTHYFNKLCVVQRETITTDDKGKTNKVVDHYDLSDPRVRESQAGYRFMMFAALAFATIPAWIMIF